MTSSGPLLSWGANAPWEAVDILIRMKFSFESEECELSIDLFASSARLDAWEGRNLGLFPVPRLLLSIKPGTKDAFDEA